MSFLGDARHTPAGDPQVPLMNLSMVRARMDSLHQFLSDSIETNTLIAQPEMEMVSSEIAAAIHQIMVNGAALLSCAPSVCSNSATESREEKQSNPDPNPNPGKLVEAKVEDDYEIIEMDAVELLAEHLHFCEICGKGFKRDANLRMHMRAHGNQYKTAAALAKPEKGGDGVGRKTRFSCPYGGCNRNKQHKKFRALKSVICVKNHFKRSHCPKMYSCDRCNKKSFSVVADLKSHLKHCGETKWKCSCGTSFSRKDKLFGHMALFEGHMPAVEEEEEEEEQVDNDDDDRLVLMDGFESLEFEDVLNSANNNIQPSTSSSGVTVMVMEDFFNF